MYNKHVFKNNLKAHLTERHKEVSPILIDLDFRHKPNNTARRYDNDFVNKFIKIYCKEVQKLIGDVIDDDKLVAYILEKIHLFYNKQKYIKRWNSYHLSVHCNNT